MSLNLIGRSCLLYNTRGYLTLCAQTAMSTIFINGSINGRTWKRWAIIILVCGAQLYEPSHGMRYNDIANFIYISFIRDCLCGDDDDSTSMLFMFICLYKKVCVRTYKYCAKLAYNGEDAIGSADDRKV